MTAAQGTGAYRGHYKKLINDPFDAVDEALEGFAGAHADLVTLAGPTVALTISRSITASEQLPG